MRSSLSTRPARGIGSLFVGLLILTWSAAPAVAGAASATTVSPSPAAAARPAIGGPAMATTGTITSAGAPAIPAAITAGGFVVADLDSGAIYAARNPHLRAPPASTIKTLTALVLLPKLAPHTILVGDSADANVDGTRAGIVPNGKYSVENLFQAMLMMSANDAAELLARAAGSRSSTLAEMNAKAVQLQALDTYAGTPTGLDAPRQSTSAYDLALINRATMALPAFRRYVAMRQARFGAAGGASFAIQSHNRLFRDNFPGAIGIKNGYTEVARYTFVGAARRGGHTYLVSMVRADAAYPAQAEALLNWAFALPAGAAPVGQLVSPMDRQDSSRTNTARVANRGDPKAGTTATGWRGRLGWVFALTGAAVLAGLLLMLFLRRESRPLPVHRR